MQARVSRDDGFSFYNFPDGRYYKVIIDRAVHLVFFQNSVLINDSNDSCGFSDLDATFSLKLLIAIFFKGF